MSYRETNPMRLHPKRIKVVSAKKGGSDTHQYGRNKKSGMKAGHGSGGKHHGKAKSFHNLSSRGR